MVLVAKSFLLVVAHSCTYTSTFSTDKFNKHIVNMLVKNHTDTGGTLLPPTYTINCCSIFISVKSVQRLWDNYGILQLLRDVYLVGIGFLAVVHHLKNSF